MNPLESLQISIYHSALLNKWIAEARVDGHDLCIFYKESVYQQIVMLAAAQFMVDYVTEMNNPKEQANA